MRTVSGIGISHGFSYGKCVCRFHKKVNIPMEKEENTERELFLFRQAVSKTYEDFFRMYETASEILEPSEAELFRTYLLLIRDPEFTDQVETRILLEKMTASAALKAALEEIESGMVYSEDAHVRSLRDDFRQVVYKIEHYLHREMSVLHLEFKEKTILITDTLSPSEVLSLDREHIGGIILYEVDPESHTAILSKALGIPMLLVEDADNIERYVPDSLVVPRERQVYCFLDADQSMAGFSNEIETYELYRRKLMTEQTKACAPLFIREEARLPFLLFGNINSPSEISEVLSEGGEGIGLYRSEFMFSEYGFCPDEDTQYFVYRDILNRLGKRSLTIRTFDLGYDKTFSETHHVRNIPGMRGIQRSLEIPDELKTQIRALYRASLEQQIYVMFPLVQGISDFVRAETLVREVREELETQKIPHGNIILGSMVETLEAVKDIDALAEKAAFLSIGTNDLRRELAKVKKEWENEKGENTGYGSAVGGNAEEDRLLELLKRISQAASKHNTMLAICGEIGESEAWTELLKTMHLHMISAAASELRALRKRFEIE